jgi:hypothetical protein
MVDGKGDDVLDGSDDVLGNWVERRDGVKVNGAGLI